jgi:hypothetical protein
MPPALRERCPATGPRRRRIDAFGGAVIGRGLGVDGPALADPGIAAAGLLRLSPLRKRVETPADGVEGTAAGELLRRAGALGPYFFRPSVAAAEFGCDLSPSDAAGAEIEEVPQGDASGEVCIMYSVAVHDAIHIPVQ